MRRSAVSSHLLGNVAGAPNLLVHCWIFRARRIWSRQLENVTIQSLVAFVTKRYEIVFAVVPKPATGLNVMDLKVFQAATMLAAPAITTVAMRVCSHQTSAGVELADQRFYRSRSMPTQRR